MYVYVCMFDACEFSSLTQVWAIFTTIVNSIIKMTTDFKIESDNNNNNNNKFY